MQAKMMEKRKEWASGHQLPLETVVDPSFDHGNQSI